MADDVNSDDNYNRVDLPTVCLVDDDPVIRSLFSKIIERTNCKVVTASSAMHAEAVLEKNKIHIVVSDMMMPDRKDGEQLLERVRKKYPTIPVIMMSGDWSNEAQSRMMKFGASACLVKPFNAEAFSTLIESLEW